MHITFVPQTHITMSSVHRKSKAPAAKQRKQRPEPEPEDHESEDEIKDAEPAKDDSDTEQPFVEVNQSQQLEPEPEESDDEEEPEPVVLGSKRPRPDEEEEEHHSRHDDGSALAMRLVATQQEIFRSRLVNCFGFKDENFPGKPAGWALLVVGAYERHLDVASLSPNKLVEITHIDTSHAFGRLSPVMIKRWIIEFSKPNSKFADCSSSVIYEKRGSVGRSKKGDFQLDSILIPAKVVVGFKTDALGYVGSADAVHDDMNDEIWKNKYHLRLDNETAEREKADPDHILLSEFSTMMEKYLNTHLLRIAFLSTQTQMPKKRAMLEELLENDSFCRKKGITRKGDKFFDKDETLITSHSHSDVVEPLFNKWETGVDTSPWDEIVVNEETKIPSHYARTWREPDHTSMTLKKKVFREIKDKPANPDQAIVGDPSWRKMDANPFYAVRALKALGYEYNPVKYRDAKDRDLLTKGDMLQGPEHFENQKTFLGKGTVVMIREFFRYSSTCQGKHAIKAQFMNPIKVLEQRNETSSFDDGVIVKGNDVQHAYSVSFKSSQEGNGLIID